MKKIIVKKVLSVAFVGVLAMGLCTGCGNSSAKAGSTAHAQEKTIKSTASVFSKGVYVNYAAEAENPDLNYFYVFYGDGTGSIEDGVAGTANYLEYETGSDTITFHIGSIDPVEEVFTVTSYENGIVKGHFDDKIELVFEPLTGVDIESFNAVNYVNGTFGGDCIYTNGSGWSVHYNKDDIVVNEQDNIVTFVYTGESAGTNMITVTYSVDSNAEDAIKELGKTWSGDVTYTEGIFPGTEDVKGYWVTGVSEGGSGYCMTGIARDFLDGNLLFEFDEHFGEDEAMNNQVSGVLADILNSIEFPNN